MKHPQFDESLASPKRCRHTRSKAQWNSDSWALDPAEESLQRGTWHGWNPDRSWKWQWKTLLLAESGRQAWFGGCFRKGHWNWSEDPIFPCDIGLTLKWIAVLSIPQKLSMDVQSTWWFAPAFRDGSDSAATETSAVRIPYRDGVFCVYGCPCTFKCNVNQSDCNISNL